MQDDVTTTRPVMVRIPTDLHRSAKSALALIDLSFQDVLRDVVQDELVRLIGKGSDGTSRTRARRRAPREAHGVALSNARRSVSAGELPEAQPDPEMPLGRTLPPAVVVDGVTALRGRAEGAETVTAAPAPTRDRSSDRRRAVPTS